MNKPRTSIRFCDILGTWSGHNSYIDTMIHVQLRCEKNDYSELISKLYKASLF